MQSDFSDSATKGSLSIAEVFHGHISIQAQEVPFVHSSKFDPVAEILNIMIKVWDLPVPKIMLVILSDNAPLKDWTNFEEQESFVKGLIKGSNSTSMWIFTSGLNTGISKVIGDVFQAEFNARLSEACCGPSAMKSKVSKFPLIGICQENCLTYAEKFKVLEKRVKVQNTGNNLEEQKFNLNPYHSHFLIIRDKIIDIEHTTRFLLKIEEILQGSTFLDALYEDDLQQTVPASPIPTIAILVQGDINSIHFILAHLKRKLPVLIMRGSGGLAEILAYAYYEVHRSFQKIKDIEYVENILKKSLSDKITSVFPALKDNKVAHSSFFSRILECIKFSEPPDLKYITVFNMLDLTSNLEDLPVYLMETIFNSQKEGDSYAELRRDLQLTIDWNYPKLALAKVFYKDVRFKVENDVFEQVLFKKGREEFVSLFLDNGFELYKYLNAARVVTLFEHALREEFFHQVCWEGILGYGKMMRLDEYFIDSDLNWIVESLVGIPIYISSQELNECSMDIFKLGCSKRISCDVARRKAITVLIIWALVSNRGKLAIVLWRHVDQPIMVALASSLILDKIQTYVIEGKMKEGIIDLSRRFADMAFGVFDLCYSEMPSKAYESLSKKTTEWAGHSIIDMAALSQNRNFVAHPCCQKWLTNKFMGNIKIRELSWGFVTFPVYIKVILCSFLVFPMYLWVRFKDTLVQEFIGADEYEESAPFHMPQETKERRKSVPQEEAGRTHLLKYHYPPLWQMIYWMWSAPITKFWVSHMLYIVYLGIFSLAVIWTSCGNKYLDILICVWTSLIAVDSSYRIYALIQAFPNTPVFASCLEVLYMILFVIFYVALRLLNIKGFQDPYAGKILLCAGLLCFYYRMIFIYLPISSTLGPLLYRVKRMVTVDFVNFLKLVFLILIGNGIAIQAVLYPDYPLVPEMVRKSFHKAFIAFFATPVEELAKKDPNCVTWEQKPSDGIMCRVGDYVDGTCATADGFWPYLFLFQYILLLKLILITVLFALFNNTGAKLGPERRRVE
ncbi:transient receptor potential cation channel subfamily M member 3-like isoform X2 [Stegodyphus dumicola]|uniref:transient receptor potential cation channel subfamily M member 3-like isoform X2 n=1 Tax=Stegodyphus dumicola TaxID=202533 RepID=UPI0015AA52CF|nr:transient receptor potential cation channel subfamily M member 3-like isoform X2 [Stegodyphus dumicola]